MGCSTPQWSQDASNGTKFHTEGSNDQLPHHTVRRAECWCWVGDISPWSETQCWQSDGESRNPIKKKQPTVLFLRIPNILSFDSKSIFWKSGFVAKAFLDNVASIWAIITLLNHVIYNLCRKWWKAHKLFSKSWETFKPQGLYHRYWHHSAKSS